jgi:palmitoyl-protein thioesterase
MVALKLIVCVALAQTISALPFDKFPGAVPVFEGEVAPSLNGSNYPTVTAHGMGDSCFNSGMQQITQMIAKRTGQYGVCVPTGTRLTDTINGFFMTMDKNVDVFAAKVQADPKLKNGFNCVGFSQGNSICRGYIQKYNDPPVVTFLSVHGTVSGVAGFPNCNPAGLLGPVCKPLARLCGDASYTKLSQKALFQINYFRDPMRVNTDAYKTNSQIAQWNNEGNTVNETFKANFGKVKAFAMIKAMKDTMVFPNEGEWWGHFADGQQSKVLTMKETQWYQKDLFGLKTADEAGKIKFNSTEGNHLQFTQEELMWWVDNYFVE